MTPSTGITGRLGMGRLKPAGAGGCRFGSVIPCSIGGGREDGREERRGRGEVCSGDSEQRCACKRARAQHETLPCHWVK